MRTRLSGSPRAYMGFWVSFALINAGCEVGNRPSIHEPSTWRFSPLELKAPVLTSSAGPVLKNPTAAADLRAAHEAAAVFGENNPRYQFMSTPAWGSPDYVAALAAVVNKYPHSAAALSAKYELAIILTGEREDSVREAGAQWLMELEIEHGDRREGLMAASWRVVDRTQKAVALSDEFLTELELVADKFLTMERADSVKFYKGQGRRYSRSGLHLRAALFGSVLNRAMELDDRTTAFKYAERILAEYPESRESFFAKKDKEALLAGRNPFIHPKIEW